MTLAEKTWEIATAELGTQEVPRGSNSGPRVNEYLAAVGLPPGQSWCAAFVAYCVREATKAVGGPPAFKPSGGALWTAHVNPSLVISAEDVAGLPQDEAFIFVIDHGGGKGHIGFARLQDGDLCTREGNSNDQGSREGYEVCSNVRKISAIKVFLRIG